MFMKAVQKYFNEVIQELKKVTWPSKQQTIDMTILVLVVSVIIAIYLSGLDYIFKQLVGSIIG